ncbi:type VI secretion system spike protein VgrG1b [soil metagenome]
MPTDTPLLMKLVSPFEDQLRFRSMSASEELGRPFEFVIEAVSEDATLDPYEILGELITVELELADESMRHFNGHVTDFGLLGEVGSSSVYHYQLVVRPWLWMLTRTSDCRIFQTQSIPDILKEVFAAYDVAVFDDQLTGTYSPWEYCVQYRETDFNFVSRLMEQEGIYYYFEHEEGQHTLVLVDSPSAHVATPGFESFTYTPSHGSMVDTEAIDHWVFSRGIQPGTFALTDFDFKRPQLNLEGKYLQSRAHTGADGKYFDYPGEYITPDDARRYSRTRLEELQARHETISGSGNVRALAVGSLFQLSDHPRDDQNGADCLVVSTRIHLQAAAGESGDQATSPSVHCSFSAMPGSAPFRAARLTPKPFVQGPQTAIVVGPSGEEIHTDEHGRVKVHFHWDRLGKKDENSSCWVRVATPWAGAARGWVSVPRMGDEVVVDFLEGDPDCPLITGSVYNGAQKPPWALPANKTQSGILTRSSLKGAANSNSNTLRFEDKKGSEQLFLHAEKNQDIEVENDETHWVGHDRTKTIDHDETVHVKHDRTETVDNNETITIGVNRTESVGKNETISIGVNRTEDVGSNESISIGANRSENVGANETIDIGKDRAETVGQNETVSIGKNREHTIGKDDKLEISDNRTTQIGKDDKIQIGKKLYIEAGDEITIVTGSASISMKKDGTIQIKGKDITIIGSGKIGIKASSDMTLKGSKIAEN